MRSAQQRMEKLEKLFLQNSKISKENSIIGSLIVRGTNEKKMIFSFFICQRHKSILLHVICILLYYGDGCFFFTFSFICSCALSVVPFWQRIRAAVFEKLHSYCSYTILNENIKGNRYRNAALIPANRRKKFPIYFVFFCRCFFLFSSISVDHHRYQTNKKTVFLFD